MLLVRLWLGTLPLPRASLAIPTLTWGDMHGGGVLGVVPTNMQPGGLRSPPTFLTNLEKGPYWSIPVPAGGWNIPAHWPLPQAPGCMWPSRHTFLVPLSIMELSA